ncbi:unnamed protein product [Acanthoscelides obtectus]|uniref:Uncharacterized protein n=1 Tax=Acanthoscelides obtectus TaxID=200917 RepID=A0A9P0KQ63_ACAOB|nr:unnamed protein product [Acanthoscelides obtectus]CAK1642618.1 hypothetical protein AOBTE_LOCUS13139 [Acanthoscelides obtectus]
MLLLFEYKHILQGSDISKRIFIIFTLYYLAYPSKILSVVSSRLNKGGQTMMAEIVDVRVVKTYKSHLLGQIFSWE